MLFSGHFRPCTGTGQRRILLDGWWIQLLLLFVEQHIAINNSIKYQNAERVGEGSVWVMHTDTHLDLLTPNPLQLSGICPGFQHQPQIIYFLCFFFFVFSKRFFPFPFQEQIFSPTDEFWFRKKMRTFRKEVKFKQKYKNLSSKHFLFYNLIIIIINSFLLKKKNDLKKHFKPKLEEKKIPKNTKKIL